jgi:hypothetical protein
MTPTRSERHLLRNAVDLLAAVLSVPLAVLVVGTPIALAIAVLLWIGRFARSLF